MKEKNIDLIVDYVLEMLDESKYTRLKHTLEDFKKVSPYVDYFKTDEFMSKFFGKEEETDAE